MWIYLMLQLTAVEALKSSRSGPGGLLNPTPKRHTNSLLLPGGQQGLQGETQARGHKPNQNAKEERNFHYISNCFQWPSFLSGEVDTINLQSPTLHLVLFPQEVKRDNHGNVNVFSGQTKVANSWDKKEGKVEKRGSGGKVIRSRPHIEVLWAVEVGNWYLFLNMLQS